MGILMGMYDECLHENCINLFSSRDMVTGKLFLCISTESYIFTEAVLMIDHNTFVFLCFLLGEGRVLRRDVWVGECLSGHLDPLRL